MYYKESLFNIRRLGFFCLSSVVDSCKDKKLAIDKDAVLPSNDAIYLSVEI